MYKTWISAWYNHSSLKPVHHLSHMVLAKGRVHYKNTSMNYLMVWVKFKKKKKDHKGISHGDKTRNLDSRLRHLGCTVRKQQTPPICSLCIFLIHYSMLSLVLFIGFAFGWYEHNLIWPWKYAEICYTSADRIEHISRKWQRSTKHALQSFSDSLACVGSTSSNSWVISHRLTASESFECSECLRKSRTAMSLIKPFYNSTHWLSPSY